MTSPIATIHDSMKELELTRVRFDWALAGVKSSIRFSVLATIGRTGRMFILGGRGHNLFCAIDATTMELAYPSSQIEEDVGRAAQFLGLTQFGPAELVSAFFRTAALDVQALNQHVRASVASTLTSASDAVYHIRQGLLSEARAISDFEIDTKRFFVGWRVNGPYAQTTSANLEKLALLGGSIISLICEEHDISSRWSDVRYLDQELRFNRNSDYIQSYVNQNEQGLSSLPLRESTLQPARNFESQYISLYTTELFESIREKLNRSNKKMLTPQLTGLLDELNVRAGRLGLVEQALLQELRMLDTDKIISARCAELISRLPPQELPSKGRCHCCDRPI